MKVFQVRLLTRLVKIPGKPNKAVSSRRIAARLTALLNTASGATWVSIHHGDGVGIGYSIHVGQVIVADGTPEAAERLSRVLTNDLGTGMMRHIDAGYEEAVECAQERGVKIPMMG